MPEVWEASEKQGLEEVLSMYKWLIASLQENSISLLSLESKEALAADSEVHIEELDEQMLLSEGQGAEIAKCLKNYEGASEVVAEVERAIEQVQKSLSAKRERKAEKDELESATKVATKTVTNDAVPKQ